MPTKDPPVIEIDSDSEDDSLPETPQTLTVKPLPIDLSSKLPRGKEEDKAVSTTKPRPDVYQTTKTSPVPRVASAPDKDKKAAGTTSAAISLPRSRILAGKAFIFRGTWATMTLSAAEALCTTNGGFVSFPFPFSISLSTFS